MGKRSFFFIFIILFSLSSFSKTFIDKFKVWQTASDKTYRVTLDFKEKPSFSKLNSGSDHYLIINFKDSVFKGSSQIYRIKNEGFDYIKLAQFDPLNVRLVAKVNKNFKYRVFIMNKNSDFPYRAIIDYFPVEKNIQEESKSLLPTVVIDPGHGGIDSGAIGKNGTYEKDIVLDIATNLEKQLWETGKVNPVLTREKDEYIGLKNRVQLTENKNAVMFVSIHNNAEPTGKARGYRVYILSEDGKADKAGQMVAQKENNVFELSEKMQDRIKDKNVLGILYDLKLNQTISESSKFAHELLNNFRTDFKTVDEKVRRAPFYVLKLAGIPGVLFECGFISNKTDERMLKNKFYREKIASSVKKTVLSYLEDKKLLASEVKSFIVPEYYQIQSGDTLIKIANKFKMELDELRKINNLNKSSKIYAGKNLKIKG